MIDAKPWQVPRCALVLLFLCIAILSRQRWRWHRASVNNAISGYLTRLYKRKRKTEDVQVDEWISASSSSLLWWWGEREGGRGREWAVSYALKLGMQSTWWQYPDEVKRWRRKATDLQLVQRTTNRLNVDLPILSNVDQRTREEKKNDDDDNNNDVDVERKENNEQSATSNVKDVGEFKTNTMTLITYFILAIWFDPIQWIIDISFTSNNEQKNNFKRNQDDNDDTSELSSFARSLVRLFRSDEKIFTSPHFVNIDTSRCQHENILQQKTFRFLQDSMARRNTATYVLFTKIFSSRRLSLVELIRNNSLINKSSLSFKWKAKKKQHDVNVSI